MAKYSNYEGFDVTEQIIYNNGGIVMKMIDMSEEEASEFGIPISERHNYCKMVSFGKPLE